MPCHRSKLPSYNPRASEAPAGNVIQRQSTFADPSSPEIFLTIPSWSHVSLPFGIFDVLACLFASAVGCALPLLPSMADSAA